ncbi:MAG: AzlC family ABC transporter permease [Anaerolineales bacterium]|nr:AzlC family ABC transporter permease [Anaerolineales bacterium]
MLGVVPFGVIFGALAVSAGIPAFEAQSFSLFIFAGSAQFIAVSLIAGAASPFLIILTILVVNFRHLLYSASLAPHVYHLSNRWKIPLSWLLTDEAFIVASSRYRKGNLEFAHWYFLGTGLMLWVAWQLSTLLGIALGVVIPPGIGLDFALPLTFMALILPTLTDRPAWAAACAAGMFSILLANLPFKLGLLIPAVLGIGVGLGVEIRAARAGHANGGKA